MSPAPTRVEIIALPGLPEVRAGDDLAELLLAAVAAAGERLRDGDVLVVSSKVVSKAAGLRADAAAKAAEVLRQSRRVVAERATPAGVTRIVESVAGPVMAAAGIDASNTGDGGQSVLLLPADPDAAAGSLRRDLLAQPASHDVHLGVVISDTAGRPWRVGQTDFALGSSGVEALEDLRGSIDADGRALSVTARAVADEVAAAADLVKGKSGGVAAALVRGLRGVVAEAGLSAGELVRTGPGDWFALGHVEAIRSALGVEPGTAEAFEVGLPPAGGDDVEARLARACALALQPTSPEVLAEAAATHPLGSRFVDPTPDGVEIDVVQAGVRVRAADDYRLGQAVARVCVALTSEGLRGWPTPPQPQGTPPRNSVLVVVAASGDVTAI